MPGERIPKDLLDGTVGLFRLIVLAPARRPPEHHPIRRPVARPPESLGIDPTHFGIIMVLNLCIGLCTPPVGSVLFVGVGVANTTISKVIKPLLPLFFAMVISLFIVTYVPELSMWLPRLFGF